MRFPMPGSLDHINIWLLEDGDGWTVVDTSLALDDSKHIWETLFSEFMGGSPSTESSVPICTPTILGWQGGSAGNLTVIFG